LREAVRPSEDPLSYEYILVDDQRRQMRFERDCPNPVWWFDTTHTLREPVGSAISWVNTSDVDIHRSRSTCNGDSRSIRLRMRSQRSFRDYAICPWRLPGPFAGDHPQVKTDAREFILVKDAAGELHLVLMFDHYTNC
jgi:hypothetical protein